MFKRNSTIESKQKICVACGKPCFWFSKKRCQQCATRQSVEKKIEKQTENEISNSGLQELIYEADSIVSLFVRLSHANEFGMVKCYTCPAIYHYSVMQAGHYISRGVMLLRFDVTRNLRPQCYDCNCGKHGNLAVYSKELEKEKPGLPDILFEESNIVYKVDRDEIRAVITEYTPKVQGFLLKIKNSFNEA